MEGLCVRISLLSLFLDEHTAGRERTFSNDVLSLFPGLGQLQGKYYPTVKALRTEEKGK